MSCIIHEEKLLKYSVIHAQLELCETSLQKAPEARGEKEFF